MQNPRMMMRSAQETKPSGHCRLAVNNIRRRLFRLTVKLQWNKISLETIYFLIFTFKILSWSCRKDAQESRWHIWLQKFRTSSTACRQGVLILLWGLIPAVYSCSMRRKRATENAFAFAFRCSRANWIWTHKSNETKYACSLYNHEKKAIEEGQLHFF